jgi:hypothetical protein
LGTKINNVLIITVIFNDGAENCEDGINHFFFFFFSSGPRAYAPVAL